MRKLSRGLIAVLLLGATVVWLPATANRSIASFDPTTTALAADNGNENIAADNGNDNGSASSGNDNGSASNSNDNDLTGHTTD